MKTETMIILGIGAAALIAWGGNAVIDLSNASENEKQFAPVIVRAELDHGIPAGLLHRLIRQESAFRTDIITGRKRSSAGALGIAQFMPATAREELGSVEAALDPYQAITGAARYLKKLKNATGSWEKAVASYNWGIGNVTRKGLAAAPKETRDYVRKVYGSAIA